MTEIGILALAELQDHPERYRGLRGVTGPQGVQGPKGPKGDKGDPGPQGDTGKPGLRWRGPWKSDTRYEIGDAIERDGSSFVATEPSKGRKPSDGGWDLVAQKGAQGEPGRRGSGSGGAGATDHGALTGLADDDHPQYLTQAEGDAAYAPIGASALTVSDEGVSRDTAVTSIDFTGAVTATNVGHAITVDVPATDLSGYIPQGGPLTEDLLSGNFSFSGAAAAGGAAGLVQTLDATADEGGQTFVKGGNGAAGKAGGLVTITAGEGDDGADAPAAIYLTGGDGAGNPGIVVIQTAGSVGNANDALLAQGDGTALWAPLGTAAFAATGDFVPTGTDWTDLTDGGATTLHSHAGGGGLSSSQVGARVALGV